MGRPCAFLMCIASIFDGPRGFMIRWHQLTNGGFTSLEKVTQPRFLSLKCAILRASGGGGGGGGRGVTNRVCFSPFPIFV